MGFFRSTQDDNSACLTHLLYQFTELWYFFSSGPLWIETSTRWSTFIILSFDHAQKRQRGFQCWTWPTLWLPKLLFRACQAGQISQCWLKARPPSSSQCFEQLAYVGFTFTETFSCFLHLSVSPEKPRLTQLFPEHDAASRQEEQFKATTCLLTSVKIASANCAPATLPAVTCVAFVWREGSCNCSPFKGLHALGAPPLGRKGQQVL